MAGIPQPFLKVGNSHIRAEAILAISIEDKIATTQSSDKEKTYRLATIQLLSGIKLEFREKATVQVIADWVEERSRPMKPGLDFA